MRELIADGATDTGNTGVVNVLTMQDEALHDTQTDCWVVYYNQVCDMAIFTDQC